MAKEKKTNERKSPWTIYNNLRKRENRMQFWAISISVFVCFFTIWMGLTYKSVIIDSNDADTKKVYHTKMVNKRLFFKDKLLSICDSILIESLYINSCGEMSEIDVKVKKRYVDNWESFLSIADSVIRITNEAKFYLEKDDYDQIFFNNQKLSMLIPLIRNVFQNREHTIQEIHNNAAFYAIKYYIEQNSLDKSAENVNLTAFLPYVDTLNADIKKYNESKIAFEKLKRQAELIEMKVSTIDSSVIIASGIKEQLDSLQVKKQQCEILPDYTLGLIVYKNIVNNIMANYLVIASSVEPIEDQKVNLIPRSWSDVKDIWQIISDTNFSNNLKLILISLATFIVVAIILWYFLVRGVFRNANDYLTGNKYGWESTKDLEEAIEKNKKHLRELKESKE